MMTKKKAAFVVLLLVLLIAVFLGSLVWGQVDVSVSKTVSMLSYQLGIPGFDISDLTREQRAVLWYIRMPRTIVGILVGAALGVSGAVMQGVFSNPLADPGIIGVSGGAATGAVLSIALGCNAESMFTMPAFAFVGALISVAITTCLAMKHGKVPPMVLLLSGVAVGMFLGAMTSGILTFMNEQQMHRYLFWMVGGLDYRRWEHVYIAGGPIICGTIIMCMLGRHLNILVLGDVEAKAVGMPVVPFRLFLLFIASIITATAVCVSGNIGFVGLVVPHMMRMVVGPDHRILLPVSALMGAIFLAFCDTLGRMLIPPAEIRVGIMTALLGTPYFLYLLRRMKKSAS